MTTRAAIYPGQVRFACPGCGSKQYVNRRRWRRCRGVRCRNNRYCPYSVLVTRLPSGPVARLRPACDYRGNPFEGSGRVYT